MNMKKSKIHSLLLCAAMLLTGCARSADETTASKISLKEVTRGDLLIGLTADGKIALPVTPLDFEVSGKISNIYVSAGSVVKKGDILAELDDSDLSIALENARITLAKAESAYSDAIISAEYSLKTEIKNLDELKKKYDSDFDDYNYQKSIEDAATNLNRKSKDLAAAKKDLENAMAAGLENFDSYTYDNSISSAKLTLQRKSGELTDAQKALEEAQADYAKYLKGVYYDYNTENQKKTLERKSEELADAKKALEEAQADYAKYLNGAYYDYNTENQKKTLERKKAELSEAEKNSDINNSADYNTKSAKNTLEQKKQDLEKALASQKEALAENPKSFDSYTYDESIKSAALNFDRKKTDHYAAISALDEICQKYQSYLSPHQDDENAAKYSSNLPDEAKKEIESAQKAAASAETALEDARNSYDKAVGDKARALVKYGDDEKTRLENSRSDAQKAVESAQKAVTDAQFNLEKIQSDAQKAVQTAQTAVADAKDSLDKSNADLGTSLQKAADDAKTKLKTAQTSYDDAKDSLDKSNADLGASLQKAADDAKTKLKTAQTSYDDAKISHEKAQTDKTRAQLSYISDGGENISKNIKDAQTKYDSAKNSYDDAAASLKSAQENLARARESYEKDLENTLDSMDLSKMKIENMNESTSSVDNALYNVEDAKNNLKTAENNLAKNKLIAPIDGEILSVSRNVGEVVSGSENMSIPIMGALGASNSVMTLCDTSKIYLTANITESDINSVETGQTIRVSVDALENKQIYAEVKSVGSIPNVDSSGIITYEVIGILNETDKDIKDNMSLFLTFIKAERPDVLMIPNKAVFVEEGRQYVNVAVNGDEKNLEKRAVVCGLSNGTQTELTEGLAEGEIVAVGGSVRK